jgi:hypothetical protein
MIEIELTQDKHTVLDDIDADLGSQKWFAHREGHQSSRMIMPIWYAIRSGSRRRDGKQHRVSLHRVILERIMNRPLTKLEHADHINHDGLDNRRANLRIVTPSENCQNRRNRCIPKSSKYKGVCWHNASNSWVAQIYRNYKKAHLGCFKNEEDAARAYDNAAKTLFGDYRTTNFEEGT